MRIKVVRKPAELSIDGIQLDRFEIGRDYEVGTTLGALFLAERWAEPVAEDASALVTPFSETDPFERRRTRPTSGPTNLIREKFPPYNDSLPIPLAADLERRRQKRR
jgi:hypothetical protein